MIKALAILGRQPAIGIAELEAIYGSELLRVINNDVVGVDVEVGDIVFDRLGGTIKLCRVVGEINSVDWIAVEKSLLSNLDLYVPRPTSGKLQLGLSVYGLNVGLRQVQNSGLRLKQTLRNAGQSVRLVPNQSLQLNSAQVLHNRLDGDKGIELILVKDGGRTVVAHTSAVQNITSYTIRDRGRPKRDARVGMLPPKLAQIIINLANPSALDVVLDPFCGTGVVLQEAGLMGYEVYGSDLEPRMIEFTQTNLEWSRERFNRPKDWILEVGDATGHQWQPFDTIASEAYLGQPFSAFPDIDKLHSVIHTCNLITENFLRNLYPQLKSGGRICLAVPAWQDPKNSAFYHLPLLDHIGSLGYNRVSFSLASNRDLIYYRPGQVVGRELIVITRN